ncbi:hypothetical protein BCV69DRAFT_299586 [Microstroma glucosiphilum]|uniref:Xylanolytic transcriptional activator regulatory domain-containing protein n=1 Tax=Pseudomicrostroma glucosiphilum TaxID=1684307 RepID=A0A316U5D6_9BASI|nr:hypothetical protein BCV69DRAFT_299586 [Pseudomicrostroma glucosiphilum]PWN20462.1 hypothetical protein BCV69DRAFT_299586 [Pseudomicrostroma glucosiphilum]
MHYPGSGLPDERRAAAEQSFRPITASPHTAKRARIAYAPSSDLSRAIAGPSSHSSPGGSSSANLWRNEMPTSVPGGEHRPSAPLSTAERGLVPAPRGSHAPVHGDYGSDVADQGTQHTASSSSSSVVAADEVLAEKGTLMFERSGKATYYGPGSHSFLLAQPASGDDELYSRAASPQSQYSSDEDEESQDGQGGLAYNGDASRPGLRKRDSSGRRTVALMDTSPTTTATNGPYSVEAVRQTILDNPVAFMAIPGVMPPFRIEHLVQQLCAHLPPLIQARRAFRAYQQNCSWMYDPIMSLDRLWEDFYEPKTLQTPRRSNARAIFHPHRVSLIFCVLSLGVLFDVKRGGATAPQGEKRDRRAERYYHWAWVALQLSNSSDSHTVEHVQSIHLIGQYLCNRKNGRNADSFFPLMGTAVRSAIAMGLHREGGAWNILPEELEERRRLFWELYASDSFRSLAYGRPCSVQDAHCDAIFPTQRPQRKLSDVFHTVKYQVVRLMNRILDACQRSTTPYTTVLEFDRALRALWAGLPAELNPLPMGRATEATDNLDRISILDDEDQDIGMTPDSDKLHLFLQGHTIVANINQALLHLHRPWFVRALQHDQQPPRADRSKARDAFDSRFARSIVAVSESSRSLIQTAQAILDCTPTLGMAWNFWWQHAFNGAVCMYLQVVHNPSSMTTFGAWDDARRALMILQQARPDKEDVIWAGKIDLLKRLHARAEGRLKGSHDARKGHSRQESEHNRTSTPHEIPHDEQEEHLRLVGVTSSIDRRDAARRSSADDPSRNGEGAERTSPLESNATMSPQAPRLGAALDTDSNASLVERSHSGQSHSIPHSSSDTILSPHMAFGNQQTTPSHASDWIPSLSHSLIGSLFDTSSSAHSLPVDIGNVQDPRGEGQQMHMAQNQPGGGSGGGGVPAGDSAQFDWLLTELLQGGAEPEASFWETMVGGQTSG